MRARFWLTLLTALVCGDFIFIGLHLLHLQTSWLPAERWSIARDHGFAELFQYLKYVAVCLVLGHLFLQTQLRVMLAWLAVFLFLLLDDAGRIHERFGLLFAAHTHFPNLGGLRGRDIGELVFALLAGLLVLPLVIFAWLRGAPPARAISTGLAVLLLGLGGCGVGADLVHRMLSLTSMDLLAGLIEDGGEMFVLSLTCAYVTRLAIADPVTWSGKFRWRTPSCRPHHDSIPGRSTALCD